MNEIILHWQDIDGPHSLTLTSDKTITIGRNPDCNIVLPDKKVSRIHASVSAQADGFQLTNISQTNVIHLEENQHLTKGQSTTLIPGFVFRIGPIWFAVHAETSGEHVVKCPNCGRKVASSLKNCNHCGFSLAGGLTVTDWEESD